jgi:hypothetical protein
MIAKDTSHTQMLKTAADAFRLGMEGQASKNLIKVIDFLTPLIQDSTWPNREEKNIMLSELLEAQSRKDYLRVADLLEYELSMVSGPVFDLTLLAIPAK